MGDLELLKNQHEVDCALTVLGYCYKFESLKDEVYCQIMKQTTNNKSQHHDSCQKGWRLFSIIGRTATPHTLQRKSHFMYSQKRNCAGLSLNFHIHMSVRDLYIPRNGPHIFLQQNRQTDGGNVFIAHRNICGKLY
jgi:hypothetical protein